MKHNTFNWTQEGSTFFGQYWAIENPKAVVAIVHGMGEHSTRYADYVVPRLNEAGYAVISFDHFGHGQTNGKRGHCPSYNAVLDSIDNILKEAEKVFDKNLPIFLYGHSMGGNVVSNYIIQRDSKIKGAIISSPMLRLSFTPPAWKMAAGKIMKHIYPAFQESTGLESSAVSRDRIEVEKYINDPLVHDKITVNFSLPFFEAGENAIKNAAKIKVPAFLVHGTADRLTDYKGSELFAKNAGNKAEIKLYEGGYHELHNDIIKEEVLNDIISWLNQHN